MLILSLFQKVMRKKNSSLVLNSLVPVLKPSVKVLKSGVLVPKVVRKTGKARKDSEGGPLSPTMG